MYLHVCRYSSGLLIMSSSPLVAASVQFQHKASDIHYNLQRVRHFVELAAKQNVRLLCFPEMCATGYWHVRNLSIEQIRALAETIPNGLISQQVLSDAAKYNMVIGVGLIELAEDGQLYNSYLVAEPDGQYFVHRKLHTFIHPQMASGNRYTFWDSCLGIRIGVLTCWDNNLVENARINALNGVDVLLAPHQTGGCNSRSPQAMGLIDPVLWQQRDIDPESLLDAFNGDKGRGWLMRWLPARAHDNGMFILFSNGVGLDDDEVRTGNAMLLDCYGRILNESNSIADCLVTSELDLSLLAQCTGRRWLRGRRPDLYQPIVHSQQELVSPYDVRFSKI